jgi:hypothetical protein
MDTCFQPIGSQPDCPRITLVRQISAIHMTSIQRPKFHLTCVVPRWFLAEARNKSENGPSGAFERGYKIWSPKNTREIWSPSTSNRLHRDLPPTAPPPLSSISAAGLDSANSGHFLPRRPSAPISIPPRGTASPTETIVWDPAYTEMSRRSW